MLQFHYLQYFGPTNLRLKFSNVFHLGSRSCRNLQTLLGHQQCPSWVTTLQTCSPFRYAKCTSLCTNSKNDKWFLDFLPAIRLLKVARFVSILITMTKSSGVVEIFVTYRTLREIICGKKFKIKKKILNEFRKFLFINCGSKISMSSIYHPKIDV